MPAFERNMMLCMTLYKEHLTKKTQQEYTYWGICASLKI
jgi:hypothetical protein